MDRPYALKLMERAAIEVHCVSLEPGIAKKLEVPAGQTAPAVLVVRNAAILPNVSAGMFDAADVVAVAEGDWANALLIVWNEGTQQTKSDGLQSQSAGDVQFLKRVERDAVSLSTLAHQTISAIRKAGVDGELVETGGGRWVNRPLNTFTLKVQPRAGNLQFTLYGNPESYDAGGFLLRDQNSYSRGWVRNADDARSLAELTRQAHARRNR